LTDDQKFSLKKGIFRDLMIQIDDDCDDVENDQPDKENAGWLSTATGSILNTLNSIQGGSDKQSTPNS